MVTGIGRLTLLVDDQDEALDWYRDALGFEVIHDDETGGYRYLHIGVPTQPGIGLWLMPAAGVSWDRVGAQTGGEPLLVLYTDDLDRVLHHLQERGVEVWNVRHDTDSRSLHLRDLAGNTLIVAQLAT